LESGARGRGPEGGGEGGGDGSGIRDRRGGSGGRRGARVGGAEYYRYVIIILIINNNGPRRQSDDRRFIPVMHKVMIEECRTTTTVDCPSCRWFPECPLPLPPGV
jgi:hypothetical protein